MVWVVVSVEEEGFTIIIMVPEQSERAVGGFIDVGISPTKESR